MKEIIKSRHNETFRFLERAFARKERPLFPVEGEREIERALASGWKVDRFITTDPAEEGVCLSKELFSKLSYCDKKEGRLALFKEKTLTENEARALLKRKKSPLVAIIDTLEKPGNLGAILRTADGAGVDLVFVVEGGVDLFHPNLIRASLGAFFSLPIANLSLCLILDLIEKENVKLFLGDPDGKLTYDQADFKGGAALVFGREDRGVDERFFKRPHTAISIPMEGICDSLNVSASAAVLLYEARRQIKGRPHGS